jgi:molybdate transport system substrate-binding protein
MPRFRLALGSALLLAIAALACRKGPSSESTSAGPKPQTVLVFAAASTSDAIDEIESAYAGDGAQVRTSYASSSALAQQVLHGADADILISADEASADLLAKQSLVAESKLLLGNRLVVVVPIDSRLDIHHPADLAEVTIAAKIDRLALGDPDAVPAGKYAKKALEKLGVWDKLKTKVAAAGDVRQALAYVETGAAAAGIVYATDAVASKKVRVACELPEDLTGPVRYPLVLLKHGESSAAAKSFYRFLLSPEAAAVFVKHGFTVFR